MIPILCSALMLVGGPGESAQPARLLGAVQAMQLGKEYIGLSENDILGKLGQPSSKKPGVWEYWEPLGPGYHSFRFVRVIRWKDGKVTSAAMEMRGVGCIIVLPRER